MPATLSAHRVALARATTGAAIAVAFSACAPRRIPPPALEPPRVSVPSDALPADLDVAVRLEVSRMRSALGSQALDRLRTELGASGGDRELMADALAGADTVWAAFRPASDPANIDAVIVLRGAYERFDPSRYPSTPPFHSPHELGGDWRRYDRDSPPQRSAPARIYARGSDLLVLVSTAELDSVERSLERGVREPHVTPPARGTISLEARAAAVVRAIEERSPSAARLLRRAERLRGFAELGAGLELELEVVFEDAEAARRAADGVGLLARALRAESGAAAGFAARTSIEAVDASLIVRLRLDERDLGRLGSCVSGTDGCGEGPLP